MSVRTGIDLGTASVKLVRGEGRTRLERLTHLDVEAWDPENGKEPVERAAGALGRILGRMGSARHRLGHLAVGVGGHEAGLREVLLPRLSDEELRQALPFEARRHLTLEEMASPTIAYQILGPVKTPEGGDPQVRVLLAAVPAPQRDFALRVLATQGLEPEVIDLEPLANLNAVLALLPAADLADSVVALLDLGAHGAALQVTQADGCLLSRTIDSEAPPAAGTRATAEFAEALAHRVAETLTFYRARYRRDVTRLHVGGGGALLEGLCPALQSALEMPVTPIDPFEGVALPGAAGEDVPGSASRFVTACGLCRWWDGAHV
jgi:Tfp pilus assembly PilM family ATPase